MRIFHTGVQTEHAGNGRVRFFSFFGGAGYVTPLRRGKGWGGKGLNLWIPGFTIYIRTHAPSNWRKYSRYGDTVLKFIKITRRPNIDFWALNKSIPEEERFWKSVKIGMNVIDCTGEEHAIKQVLEERTTYLWMRKIFPMWLLIFLERFKIFTYVSNYCVILDNGAECSARDCLSPVD